MTKTNIFSIKEELVVFLRNQDILSTDTRGVTTNVSTSSLAGVTSYVLSNTPTLLKNLRSVQVAGVTASFGNDYTVNYDEGRINFNTSQTGISTAIYDAGNSDRIFPDFPQPNIKLSQFPRIAVESISGSTKEIELGAGSQESEYVITIVIYDKGLKNVEDLISDVRSNIMDNKKSFYYFPFISLTSMGPMLVSPFGDNKVFQRNQDCIVRFVFEN